MNSSSGSAAFNTKRATGGATTVYGPTGAIGPNTGTYLLEQYDAASQSMATNAYNSANNAANQAINAANWATNAYNSANNATTSANNAYDAANTAASNASTAATNASNAYTAANTAASNASTAASNTTYGGQSAAYWANQAATAAANNLAPVITSVTGVNNATCTIGSSYSALATISPGSSVTYAAVISGPGGSPTFSYSGNTLTVSNLTISGAYTVNVTATYTPTGKTCQGSFMFFKI